MNENSILTFKELMDASILRLSTGGYLSSADIILALIASLACSSIISMVYKYTFQGVIYHKTFNISIILVSMITTSVVMAISGNLMLALGMVGALSIVRFRAAIKEPLDIVFLFWAITIGVANGVAFFKLSIITTITLSILLLILVRLPFSISSYMLIVHYKKNKDSDKKVIDIIKKYSSRYIIRSKNIKDDNIELVCEIKAKLENNNILNDLNDAENIIDSSIVSYSNNMLDK